MSIEHLELEAFRGFSTTTSISFHPKWTVLAGENGVGKTSILWALRVLLSHVIATDRGLGLKRINFAVDDIANGWPFLRATVTLHTATQTIQCVGQKNRVKYIVSPGAQGRPREHASDTPDRYSIKLSTGMKNQTPLVVFYSPHRSVSSERVGTVARAAGKRNAAYADALVERQLLLTEAAALWQKEAELERTDGVAARANRAIEKALPVFLGDFGNLRVEGEDVPRLVVDKRKTTLDLSQLSDGERGLLTILLDLCRRLTAANPKLDEPAKDGHAVVLIDELELHMHPRWQRMIVPCLSKAFPSCQFVATTHSPQVIGEVQAESLVVLRRDGDHIVPERCGQAFGLDTNYVLEHILGTASRAPAAASAIQKADESLETGDVQTARMHLKRLRRLLKGGDPKAIELEATINSLEALADAQNQEKN